MLFIPYRKKPHEFCGGRRNRKQIVEQLRNNGHDVLYITEISPSIPDEDVLDFAIKNEAVLLTADKDFGELIYRQRRFSLGVVLIRLADIASVRKGEIVNDAVRNYGSEFLNGFTVISYGLIRIRKNLNDGVSQQ